MTLLYIHLYHMASISDQGSRTGSAEVSHALERIEAGGAGSHIQEEQPESDTTGGKDKGKGKPRSRLGCLVCRSSRVGPTLVPRGIPQTPALTPRSNATRCTLRAGGVASAACFARGPRSATGGTRIRAQ